MQLIECRGTNEMKKWNTEGIFQLGSSVWPTLKKAAHIHSFIDHIYIKKYISYNIRTY